MVLGRRSGVSRACVIYLALYQAVIRPETDKTQKTRTGNIKTNKSETIPTDAECSLSMTGRCAGNKKIHACHDVGLDDQSNNPQQDVVVERATHAPMHPS
jgi:hypothetical protein